MKKFFQFFEKYITAAVFAEAGLPALALELIDRSRAGKRQEAELYAGMKMRVGPEGL